jgi:hypothetical protein
MKLFLFLINFVQKIPDLILNFEGLTILLGEFRFFTVTIIIGRRAIIFVSQLATSVHHGPADLFHQKINPKSLLAQISNFPINIL